MFLAFLMDFCFQIEKNLPNFQITNDKVALKPQIQSCIKQFFKNNKKWVLSDSM